MRKVILKMDVSLDGYVGTKDGDVQPLIDDGFPPRLEEWLMGLLSSAGTHAMGRVLYHDMAGYWPTSASVYAQPMNDIPKVVFSKTLEATHWDETRVMRGPVDEEITRLREEPGGPILVHGGSALVQSLNRAGLIDEYHLIVRPVALGQGLPIFADRVDLELTGSTTYENGAVLMSYARKA